MSCIDLDIAVNFDRRKDGEELPPSRAFAFDSAGALVASAPVDAERVTLAIPRSSSATRWRSCSALTPTITRR